MRLHFLANAFLVFLSLACGTCAADSAISIHDPYVRLPPPGIKTTGAFMLIRNAGTDDRRLIRAESPIADIVELHDHINENGMMKMREVSGIAVKAGGQAELKPGSFHIMLIDLKDELREGGSIPITLIFDDGSRHAVQAEVRRPHPAQQGRALSSPMSTTH